MADRIQRGIYIVLGCLSLVAAVIGAILPLVPTTVFLLMACWFFARSSERMHNWLLSNKHFGPMIKQWQDERSIDRVVKIRAIFLVVISFSLTLIFVPVPNAVRVGLVLLAIGISTFLYRLPETVKESVSKQEIE